MFRCLQPLFLLLLRSAGVDLARIVEYLRAENGILRSRLPGRITVTPQERNRLVKLGAVLGEAIKGLVTFVTPRTFLRWVNDSKPRPKGEPAKAPARRKPGRPKTPEEVAEIILRIARETAFGYTRILGELKKLGIHDVSRSTVVNILKSNGLDPGPKRGQGTWSDFLTRHAATLWASDFFSVRTWTLAGVVDLYVLFFIHLQTRKVFLAGVSANPTRDWVTQLARNFTMHLAEQGLTLSHLIIDHDSKYTESFDTVIESEGAEVVRVGPRAPNLNPVAERFVQTVKSECLGHFVIFGEKHLLHLLKEFGTHYHEERAHQGLGNRPPAQDEHAVVLPFAGAEVRCRERLGGLLKHDFCDAA
jgi:putative transposase